VPAEHYHLMNVDRALGEVAVGDSKRDLFRLAQAGEKTKLIEIANGLARFDFASLFLQRLDGNRAGI